MNIKENIRQLAEKHSTSITKVEKELGFGGGTITKWDKSAPTADKLLKVAEYFNVTVDNLLGNEEIPVALSRDNGYDGLTEEQIEMIEIMKAEYRQRNIKKNT